MTSISVRALAADDCDRIAQAFAAQGWQKPAAQYRRYMQESIAGARAVLVAEATGSFAGYLSVVWESTYPPFREAHIPEIKDFNVLQRYQRRGVGAALMDAAERLIATRSPIAGIGVGLTADYGAAQILYVKRGFVPDGRGLSQHGQPLAYGDQAVVNDDLVLYFIKALSPPSAATVD